MPVNDEKYKISRAYSKTYPMHTIFMTINVDKILLTFASSHRLFITALHVPES